MAERLQAMMASQQRLLSDVSHELRTPLTAIIGYGESIIEDQLTPEDMHRHAVTP